VSDFFPGDFIEETIDNRIVGYYIVLTRHYLNGCKEDGMILGYYTLIVYSTGHALPTHSPGSNWFIKHSDLQKSDFRVVSSGKLLCQSQ